MTTHPDYTGSSSCSTPSGLACGYDSSATSAADLEMGAWRCVGGSEQDGGRFYSSVRGVQGSSGGASWCDAARHPVPLSPLPSDLQVQKSGGSALVVHAPVEGAFSAAGLRHRASSPEGSDSASRGLRREPSGNGAGGSSAQGSDAEAGSGRSSPFLRYNLMALDA